MSRQRDLVVVGGGVIGLSIAWLAASRGTGVTVVDPSAGRGATWAAAGMLAPVSEAHFGEEELVQLLCAGASRWDDFAARLEEATGLGIGFERTGTLLVAHRGADRSELRRLVDFQHSLGLAVEELDADEVRQREPGLSPSIRAGAFIAGDRQVDNRALVAALLAVLDRCGVEMLVDSVIGIDEGEGGPTTRLASGASMGSKSVVLAAGAHLGSLEVPLDAALPTIRPVKGHVIRLSSAAPLIAHTIRASVRGRAVYLVPRSSGEIVVGATVEEQGFDDTVRAGEVFSLLEDARQVVPGLDFAELLEVSAGLRPGSSNNAPSIGWTGMKSVAVAGGHYRNGILLAPITAEMVVALLYDEHHPGTDLLAAAHQGGLQ